MDAPELIMLGLTVVNGAIVPIIIYLNSKNSAERKEKFNEIHDRLTHLDDCMDTTQKLVIGRGATREDLATIRAEMADAMNRMRAAFAAEAAALGSRVMRLEDRQLGQVKAS